MIMDDVIKMRCARCSEWLFWDDSREWWGTRMKRTGWQIDPVTGERIKAEGFYIHPWSSRRGTHDHYPMPPVKIHKERKES